ncbi:hypothetical protein PCI56_02235 [Plesiomonas shigelloides subsp. oncorhynchi]|nr:hypothetical protein [Plesiomonas shigelloides]
MADKLGFGVAPDPRYHHAKPTVDGNVVLFPEGHGAHFKPSQTFNDTSVMLRFGAMVATVDEHIDRSELNTLYDLIENDSKLSSVENVHYKHTYTGA